MAFMHPSIVFPVVVLAIKDDVTLFPGELDANGVTTFLTGVASCRNLHLLFASHEQLGPLLHIVISPPACL